MIIVKLRGGLGNQLFQYATARALALRHATPLKFDREWFDNRPAADTARTYMLDGFAIEAEFATRREILQNRYAAVGRNMNFLSPVFAYFCNPAWGWYRERFFHYDPAFKKLGDSACLDGYWQSARYFEDFAEQIRTEVTITKQLNRENAKIAGRIFNSSSVAVHIRRGDYAHNPETSRVHGICPLSYYQEAMALLADKLDNISFFVFSDDSEWARNNLNFKGHLFFFINNKYEDAYQDLHLMALCQHHIIANSTFSWWGAWLGKKHRQIVIAPRKWFNDPSINTDDLIPGGWLRL